MSSHIHPLVLAEINEHGARRELELERLRSAREACSTASPDGQSRALALGKKIREVERITASWRFALATLQTNMEAMGEVAEEVTKAFREMLREIESEPSEPSEPRVVGSKAAFSGALRCVNCTAQVREDHPKQSHRVVDVTSEDLPDGGMCNGCGADVLA
jgi:hypothetical protein